MKITLSRSQWEGIGKKAGWFGDTFRSATPLSPEQNELLKKLAFEIEHMAYVVDAAEKGSTDNYEQKEKEISRMIGQLNQSFKGNTYFSSVVGELNNMLVKASNTYSSEQGANWKNLRAIWEQMAARVNKISGSYNRQ